MESILEKENIPFPQKTDRELLEELQERMISMEKRAQRRSILAWMLVLVLIVAAAVTAISLYPRYQAMKAQQQAVSAMVQQLDSVIGSIDVQKLQDAADFVGSVDYAKLMELGDMLETMDTGELKAQIEQISTLVNQLGELNTEALVDNINLIIEKLQPVLNWLR
ncbi:MAG: hypothetical protein IJZ91_01840 [Oscillospiraceae bacterium]|nr:hypothetical protein [Oscillospiraceae bacterium]